MKDYAKRKKNKKWSVAKNKVVTSPAVTEVKDDDGVVVRSARAEVSHEAIQLTQKRYDAETGKALADENINVSVEMCDNSIADCDKRIADINAEKDGWTVLKTDIEAL